MTIASALFDFFQRSRRKIMEHFIYVAALLAVAGIAAFLLMKERRAAAGALQERDNIEVEERRMFDFLHGLGEALHKDSSKANLHRYIVDGVARVVGANAGILYILDQKNQNLVPTYQTENPAPVIPLPVELFAIEDPAAAVRQLRSFIRLSAIGPDNSFIGKTLQSVSQIYAKDIVKHPLFQGEPNPFQSEISLLAAPLVYGQKKIGVLAVTGKEGECFSQNDRDVFESISEQSSFALGSAIIHADAHEKHLLEREIKQASDIQKVLLPRESPQLSDFTFAACYQPARLVSGDYYDYVKIDDDHYGVAIGDVCGKGIAASLIVAMCRSLLRSAAGGNLSPAAVLDIVNQSIFPDIREDMFVSLLYLILERESDVITLARAGHEPPLLFCRDTGKIEAIEPPGLAAGVDGGDVFRKAVNDFRFTMKTGDILILYTDGLTEAANRDGDEFGIDGLTRIISEAKDRSPQEIVKSVEKAVSDFSEGTRQSDDITLIAMEKR